MHADSAPVARAALALGRHAAHAALRQIGFDQVTPILRNTDRSARWPNGAVGSISHSRRADFIVAVAISARSDKVESLGVDVEDLRRGMSETTIKKVCTPREQSWIAERLEDRTRRALQLFSAKETLFKLFAPIFDGPKTFQGADLAYDEGSNSFEAVLTPAISPHYPAYSRHRVFLQEANDFILTAAALLR